MLTDGQKTGDFAFFLCRMLPCSQDIHFFPAGILKANLARLIAFNLSVLLSDYVLVFVGLKFGDIENELAAIWHKFDYAIVAILFYPVCAVCFQTY